MNRLCGTVTESRAPGLASSLFSPTHSIHLPIHSVLSTASRGISSIPLPCLLATIAAHLSVGALRTTTSGPMHEGAPVRQRPASNPLKRLSDRREKDLQSTMLTSKPLLGSCWPRRTAILRRRGRSILRPMKMASIGKDAPDLKPPPLLQRWPLPSGIREIPDVLI